MKIIEILPELDMGGVERHVIDLANTLAEKGHEVAVVSNGGRMECQLSDKVNHICLPVHKKNIFTGYSCAKKLAEIVNEKGYELIHAHSRVPAWIAMWVASMTGIALVVTAHSDFSTKTKWIYKPYRKAGKTICVSAAVQEGMKECFFDNTKVILNGLDTPAVSWKKPEGSVTKFLFVGRLTKIKGVDDILNAMPKEREWTLDVLGDGPVREELENQVLELGLTDRVTFHGYSDKADEFMAKASCLLFPSHTEGMGLVLARAAQIGLPFISSDLPPIRYMAGTRDGLIAPGDIPSWSKAINEFIDTGKAKVKIPLSNIPTLEKMVNETEAVYREVLEK